MSAEHAHAPGAEPADSAAHGREAAGELVRHSLSARAVHWTVAGTFFACLLSGMPIWSPVFGWMAELFGGLAVCRWLHPWLGVAFFAASAAMFAMWAREMVLLRSERGWLGPKLLQYMRYEAEDPNVGKYNGGQKLLFWAVSLGSLGLLVSGLALWFPERVPAGWRLAAVLLHDTAYILFTVAIVGHVYLATAAEPGTFRAMTRGTVTRSWAKLHHPRWYREVTGGDSHGD